MANPEEASNPAVSSVTLVTLAICNFSLGTRAPINRSGGSDRPAPSLNAVFDAECCAETGQSAF
jgi:hypothetical protein